ncbi:MAG TPA: NADPH-dependent F420 reductase [Acidimicrobiia bacterium]
MEIGVLGATGPAGRGIAARLADAGHTVLAGSRQRARAATVVEELQTQWGSRLDSLRPATNEEAAAAGDLVVVATNWEAALETTRAHAAQLAGKVVIAMANGLRKEGREFRPVMPPEGSLAAAMQAAAPDARVVAALQHVPAGAMGELDTPLRTDVVVCGDDEQARLQVMGLLGEIDGLRALDGGSLANAAAVEAFAAVILTVNLRHKGHGTLRLDGVEA